ncbi:MAG: Invasion associated locus B family protein [Candidatus Tokpelaia hoelldobleri]|uniref:Invasion associated locus B family protein n=1 Tax=Candidatus Tokpelaia hoelldobleri TaxID=1902579 RepID=A0A1U9JWU6_9HYPH|nr:MAG: Invasion associated locus B family protein [Candidatus Tokpelaia hoelldoblerii]
MNRYFFSGAFALATLFHTCTSNAQETVSEKQAAVTQFDDWFYRCVPVEGKTVSQCEISQIQQVRQGEEAITVLTVALALTAPEKAGSKPDLLMTSVAPLNIYLPEGIRYSVDGREIVRIAYRNCNQAGCWAQQRLDAKSVTAFRKGKEGSGHFRLLDGRNINIKFSLKGFSAALDALQKGGNSK